MQDQLGVAMLALRNTSQDDIEDQQWQPIIFIVNHAEFIRVESVKDRRPTMIKVAESDSGDWIL